MQILVVDDQESMRGFMTRVIDQLGYPFAEASDGIECLAQCRQRTPDMIFLDLLMPNKDGFDTLRELRQDFPSTDVVVVSVQDDENAVAEVLHAGATAFLCKPFTADQLRNVITEVEEKRAARAAENPT